MVCALLLLYTQCWKLAMTTSTNILTVCGIFAAIIALRHDWHDSREAIDSQKVESHLRGV